MDAIAGIIPVVKPQLAFYEALGAPGWECLKETIGYAHERGVLVIADAKRSDIGSTVVAYADAILGERGLCADGITSLHYFGTEGVQPFLKYVADFGKGLFVVVRSSNASAAETQDLRLSDGRMYYEAVADLVARWGEPFVGTVSGFSAVGAVVGATYPTELRKLRFRLVRTPFLVPGYGAQGATAQDVSNGFTHNGMGAIVTASRSILELSNDSDSLDERQLRDLVRSRCLAMVHDVGSALQQPIGVRV
jgi:orotidine-5'-phosphate decarboxylase